MSGVLYSLSYSFDVVPLVTWIYHQLLARLAIKKPSDAPISSSSSTEDTGVLTIPSFLCGFWGIQTQVLIVLLATKLSPQPKLLL